jgi:hypothetical protein
MARTVTQAESFRHTAAVCRAESIARRQSHPAMSATLAQWAENFDRRAREASSGQQQDLFSEGAA